MRAISGSGIAPAEIFKIIGLSKEYPYLRKRSQESPESDKHIWL